jgi:hypothetical protein
MNFLTPFKEMFYVYTENRKKHINKNEEIYLFLKEVGHIFTARL